MYARYLNAPLLLLIWQVAPVDIRRDDGGRVRIGISAGEGRFSFRDYAASSGGVDCNGDSYPGEPAHSESDAYKVVAISAEARAGNRIRFLGVFGRVEDQSMQRDGQFVAGQAVYDQRHFGIGLGVASFGGPDGHRSVAPSALARVTSSGGVSLQADYHHPTASSGLVGGPRLGVGLHQTRHEKIRVFLGVAATPVPDSARRAGAFLEASIPINILTRRSGISISAFYAGQRGDQPQYRRNIFSVGMGGWIEP